MKHETITSTVKASGKRNIAHTNYLSECGTSSRLDNLDNTFAQIVLLQVLILITMKRMMKVKMKIVMVIASAANQTWNLLAKS